MDISVIKLKSLEYAKAPIRFNLANILCAKFNINQRWLATGIEPSEPYLPLLWKNLPTPPKQRFSDAYDTVLKPLIEEQLNIAESFIKGESPIKKLVKSLHPNENFLQDPTSELLRVHLIKDHVQRIFDATITRIPTLLLPNFFEKLERFLNAYEDSHEQQIADFIRASSKATTQKVTVQLKKPF